MKKELALELDNVLKAYFEKEFSEEAVNEVCEELEEYENNKFYVAPFDCEVVLRRKERST